MTTEGTELTLKNLWASIRELPRKNRLALLLNPPAPLYGQPACNLCSTSERDEDLLSLLTKNRIASIAEIGDALEIRDEEYSLLWRELGVTPPSTELRFATLWNHLPVDDRLIGNMIGGNAQQVINLRAVALRRLAASLPATS